MANKWLERIDTEKKNHSDWRAEAQRIVKMYRNDQQSRFNILFSNTEILKTSIVPSPPQPVVRRRFHDRDPVARQVARVLERSLDYSISEYDFEGTLKLIKLDWLLTGLGQTRIRKSTLWEEEDIVWDEVFCEHIPYDKFGWEPTSLWKDVEWTYITHLMDEEQLKENFPDSEDIKRTHKDGEREVAEIHEIFDRNKRKIIVVTEGEEKPLKEIEDNLLLEGFFPHPKPAFGIQTSDKIVPVPEFRQYKQQAKELQRTTERLEKLTDMLRVRGVYDASFEVLVDILQKPDGDLVPVENFATRFDGKGMESVVATMPLAEIAGVMAQLEVRKKELRNDIFEMMGISDIVRGSSVASETLGAQQIKKQSFNLRTEDRQNTWIHFISDIYGLKAEIMGEHFSVKTLSEMSGIEVTQDMKAIMESDDMRSFRLSVENEQTDGGPEEQKNRVEFLDGFVSLVKELAPGVEGQVITPDLAKQLILFGARAFKTSRQLEDAIETMTFAKPKQQDPEQAQQIQEMQAKAQEAATQGQIEVQKLQSKIQLDRQAQSFEQQLAQQKAQFEMQIKQFVAQQEIQLKAKKVEAELTLEQQEAQAKLELESGKTDVNIELARRKQFASEPDDVKAFLNDELALKRVQKETLERQAETDQQLLVAAQALIEAAGRPKEVVRDAEGNIVEIR